jgi:hypothetical protein
MKKSRTGSIAEEVRAPPPVATVQNAIENLNGLVGRFARPVRRWRDGRMLVRWIATALQEARRSFRRLRGHRDLAALIRVLDRKALDTTKEVA